MRLNEVAHYSRGSIKDLLTQRKTGIDTFIIDKLKALIGGHKVYEFRYENLSSLEGLPHHLKYSLDVSDNKLQSLVGAPKIIDGELNIQDNPIYSLENIHHHIQAVRAINLDLSKINSHVLGLLKIKRLENIYDNIPRASYPKWAKIIQEYIRKDHRSSEDLFECQNVLIEADLDEYAKL